MAKPTKKKYFLRMTGAVWNSVAKSRISILNRDRERTDYDSRLNNDLPFRNVSAINRNIMIGQFFPVTFPAQGAPNIPFRHCFIANFRMIAAKDALVIITSGHLTLYLLSLNFQRSYHVWMN